MTLYALDQSFAVVAARSAQRSVDYRCLECGSTVRLRSGPERRPHFYHLATKKQCRSAGKTWEHLQVQLKLHQALGEHNCQLEQRLPEIDRVADVCWSDRKIVFEVQYSPITADEVCARNRDYARAGYRVVWILHRRHFGRQRLTAAELFLRNRPHYFTDIDANGNGEIFDEVAVIEKGKRLLRSARAPVALDLPFPLPEHAPRYLLSPTLQRRFAAWGLAFSGDVLARALSSAGSDELLRSFAAQEPQPQHHLLQPWPLRFVQSLWHLLVETAIKA